MQRLTIKLKVCIFKNRETKIVKLSRDQNCWFLKIEGLKI